MVRRTLQAAALFGVLFFPGALEAGPCESYCESRAIQLIEETGDYRYATLYYQGCLYGCSIRFE